MGCKSSSPALAGAAHLPGMLAAKTALPVLGVPVKSSALDGLDSLLSIAQMPAGIPVATFAIGAPGARNAALFAVSIFALHDAELAAMLGEARRSRRMRCWQGLIRGRDLAARVNRMSEARRRIGILGAGQLALMLAEAAPATRSRSGVCGSARRLRGAGGVVIEVDLTDASAVAEFAKQVDLVTVESENIDAAVLEGLPLFPNAHAIGHCAGPVARKEFFLSLRVTYSTILASQLAGRSCSGYRSAGAACHFENAPHGL